MAFFQPIPVGFPTKRQNSNMPKKVKGLFLGKLSFGCRVIVGIAESTVGFRRSSCLKIICFWCYIDSLQKNNRWLLEADVF